MEIRGEHLIGSSGCLGTGAPFVARRPADGSELPGTFTDATPAEVRTACTFAEAAFDTYRHTPSVQRAAFLELISQDIGNLGETLIDRAHAETALPLGGRRNERTRTIKQLQLFA